ncbi:MAG: FliM/FliN family flagellar motor switch protein [Pirellulales bacterium]|nr:FliM/FliN family flagellar motor switch protein [Pirellulales bacterium]
MPDLSTISAGQIIAASEAHTAEIASCLEPLLGGLVTLAASEPSKLATEAASNDLAGPGLVLLFCHQNMAAVALLPASSGLLPEWVAALDAKGSERLQSLARDLSGLLFPPECEPSEVAAAYVESLNDTLERASIEHEASLVPFTLTRADGVAGTLRFVWPVTRVETVYGAIGITRQRGEAIEVAPVADRAEDRSPAAGRRRRETSQNVAVEDLPPYARSLLKIDVPVMVNLASKRQAVGRILELGVGAIIQFDKLCDEPLDLYVGNQRVAQGEAVKVGEKFGIRITTIALPDERFERVQPS